MSEVLEDAEMEDTEMNDRACFWADSLLEDW